MEKNKDRSEYLKLYYIKNKDFNCNGDMKTKGIKEKNLIRYYENKTKGLNNIKKDINKKLIVNRKNIYFDL
jgi:hypothetical protein